MAAATIASGTCWYLANGFTGEFWSLTWVAPLPVLLLAMHAPPKVGAWAASGAYLLGRLGQAAALLGRVPLKVTATPYTRLGDWFGWVNLTLALGLVGGLFFGN